MAKLEKVTQRTKGIIGMNLIFDSPAELKNVAGLVTEAYQAHLNNLGILRTVTNSPAGDGTPSHVIEADKCNMPLYEVMAVGRTGTHFVFADYADEQSLGKDAGLLIPDRITLMLQYIGRNI